MAVKLPSGYHIEGGQIVRRWSDKKGEHAEVAAFGTVEVRSIRQYTDHPGELFLTVRFTSSDATRYEDVQVPVRQITGNGKKLLDYVPDWFVLLGTSPTKRLRFLQQILNLQRAEIGAVVKVMRVGPGYHVSENGSLFYILGDVIINPPLGANIEVVPTFHLRDIEEPSGQGVSWARIYCEQGPPQAALFVAALTCYIRPVLEATHNFDRFGVFVVGESGVGKTESAKLICQLFQEEGGATLSSDRPDIFRLMSTYRDMPFLVDDLNDSGIANAMNRKRERLSEIVQQLSGSGTLSVRGEIFNVGLTTPIVTAETLLNSYSSINRTLIIAYEKPFDVGIVTWLQEHRNLYVGFLKGFIYWICQNHPRLITCVRSWTFPNLHGGVANPNAFVGFNRLMRTHKILKITVELFLLHLRETYSIPQEDDVLWRRLLEEGVNQAVFADTLKHLRKESTEQERFYVDAVLDIFDAEKQRYNAKERQVAKSFKKYIDLNKEASIDKRVPKKIFFLSSDGYYYRFRGDDFVEYLTEQYDGQCKPSKKAISAQLDKYGLLQPYGGELSYPVVEDSDHRYYNLRRNVVEDMQRERLNEFLAKVDSGGDNDDQKWIIPRR